MRVQYLRNSKGHPYATFIQNAGYFGWSLCDKEDSFNKKIGKELALDRSEEIHEINFEEVPASIRTQYRNFIMRTYVFEGINEIKGDVKSADPDEILEVYKTVLESELKFVHKTIGQLKLKTEELF